MKLNESSFLLGEELDFEKVHMISNYLTIKLAYRYPSIRA